MEDSNLQPLGETLTHQSLAAQAPIPLTDWLRDRTSCILSLFQRSATDIIAIGRYLSEVRERLGHGYYLTWIAESMPFGETAAKKYRKIAEQLGDKIVEGIAGRFESGALYILAQPTTPPQARDLAIKLATQGHIINASAVRQILKQRDDPEAHPKLRLTHRDDVQPLLELLLPAGDSRQVKFDMELRRSPDNDLITTVKRGGRRAESDSFATALKELIALEEASRHIPKLDTGPHIEWAERIGCGIAKSYAFSGQEREDLKQVAVGEMVRKSCQFDEEEAYESYRRTLAFREGREFDAGEAFRGWAHPSIQSECRRAAQQLRNGGVYRTKRGPAIIVGQC